MNTNQDKPRRSAESIMTSICEKVSPEFKGAVLAELKELVAVTTIETANNFKNGSNMLFEKITKHL